MLTAWTRLIAIAAVLVLPHTIFAAELAAPERLPKFADFPVEVYRGRLAKPVLDDEWRRERPELYSYSRENAVMAAGRYVLVVSTCGSACRSPDLVDAKTGTPLDMPSVSGWRELHDGDFTPILTRPDSRLVVLLGALNEERPNGVHYFVVDDGKLKHLRTIETGGDFSRKPEL